MAKLSLQNSFASESVDSFSGIDRSRLTGLLSEAYDMTNLRILSDGSLARRDGYTCLANLSESIAAVAASHTQPDMLYVMSDGILYLVSLSDGDISTVAKVGPHDAPACFFSMPDKLYLLCGNIYEVTPQGVIDINGYVPLIGHKWGCRGGELNEPVNMLSQRVRIHYVMDELTSRIYTGLKLQSIDAIYSNGTRIEGATIQDLYIQLPYAPEKNAEVTVFLTLKQSEIADVCDLLSCTKSYSCGRGEDALSLLFGNGSYMFRARQVSDEQVAAYSAVYPDSDGLYCPSGQPPVTDMIGGVRAVCGEPDCLIAVSQYETRRIFPDGELAVPGVGGCASQDSIAYFNGTAYIATKQGIRRLPIRSGAGELISAPLGDLLNSDILSAAVLYFDSSTGELLVSDPADGAGTVFIYNTVRACWYKFSGIGAHGFFSLPTRTPIIFWAGAELFMFSPDLNYDTSGYGTAYPIPICYRSRWSALGKPESVKRLRRLRVALSGSGSITAELSDPTGLLCQQELKAAQGEQLTLLERPLRTGRTIHLRLTLSSRDTAPTRIHGFALSAIK